MKSIIAPQHEQEWGKMDCLQCSKKTETALIFLVKQGEDIIRCTRCGKFFPTPDAG